MTSKSTRKKNLRRVPESIRESVAAFNTDECVVACAIRVGAEDLRKGVLNSLGICIVDSKLELPDRVIPPVSAGIYSERNQEGYEVVHKDRPKTYKTWSISSPNYGDWQKGYHDTPFSREIYQRDFIGPKLLTIRVECIGQELQDNAYVLQFTVEEILDRKGSDFWDQLLFNLNLLQENAGSHGVFESSADRHDYLNTLFVNWEILPVGESEEVIVRILSDKKQHVDPKVRQRVKERYQFLLSLKPRNFIKGTNEFRRYFGAQFTNDLVVFENIEYGNAIYVMFDDWEILSKRSRTELLSSQTSNFERISHTKTWRHRLHRLILEEKKKRANVG